MNNASFESFQLTSACAVHVFLCEQSVLVTLLFHIYHKSIIFSLCHSIGTCHLLKARHHCCTFAANVQGTDGTSCINFQMWARMATHPIFANAIANRTRVELYNVFVDAATMTFKNADTGCGALCLPCTMMSTSMTNHFDLFVCGICCPEGASPPRPPRRGAPSAPPRTPPTPH